MTIQTTCKALHLLTYGEAMTRLHACYQSGASVQEWQAYADGEPTCFGMCFLPSTPGDHTVLAARNAIMHAQLSLNRSPNTQPRLFWLVDNATKSR